MPLLCKVIKPALELYWVGVKKTAEVSFSSPLPGDNNAYRMLSYIVESTKYEISNLIFFLSYLIFLIYL